MLDKITLKIPIKNQDIENIIQTTNLQLYTTPKAQIYSNLETTKKSYGILIKIEIPFIIIEGKELFIIIEGSLHKYYNYINHNNLENFSNNLNIKQIQEAFNQLHENTKISFLDAQVKFLEIGMNLYLTEPAPKYLLLFESTMVKGKILDIDTNIKEKKGKQVGTCMDSRTHYKAYDKTTETKKKRSKELNILLSDLKILRIETVWKRPEKLYYNELLQTNYLLKLIKDFETVWNGVKFKNNRLFLPPKISGGQREIIKDIAKHGTIKTLEIYKEQLKNNELTTKQHRTKKEFIQKEYPQIEQLIRIEPPPENREYLNALYFEVKKCKRFS